MCVLALNLNLNLGLRRGALLGLRWEDIDRAAGVLEGKRALQWVDGELRVVEPKTRSSRRTVPLLGLGGEALAAHRDRQLEECAAGRAGLRRILTWCSANPRSWQRTVSCRSRSERRGLRSAERCRSSI